MDLETVANRPVASGNPRLKVFTFNCWGLKYVSAHRVERIHAIADLIATSSSLHSRTSSITSVEALADASASSAASPHSKPGGYDIVCLQELWVHKDFLVIKERAREAGLVYAKWFNSAALGSGLAVLSRYPILETHFYAYKLNGHPLHFIQGDFFVGKSVGSCLLEVPGVGEVEVFTTHLYAPHDVPAPEWKRAHRTAQAWELAKLARASAERGRTVFVCGDLNSVPSSLPITVLQSHGSLRDSWATLHPAGPPLDNELTYRSAIRVEGITCDSMVNTFTAGKNPNDRGSKGFGKRLDYIMFRPSLKKLQNAEKSWEEEVSVVCDDCHVTLTEPIPVLGFSFSDHFALEATFTLRPLSSPSLHAVRPTPPSPPPLTTQQLNATLSALTTKYRSTSRTSSIHLSILGICLILVPGIAVAASFQPLSFLNWIFTLLSVGVGALGATMLYTGWVGGRWEKSALKEICEEMELELEWRGRGRGLCDPNE